MSTGTMQIHKKPLIATRVRHGFTFSYLGQETKTLVFGRECSLKNLIVGKRIFWHMLRTKTQISLRIRAGWSESSCPHEKNFSSLALQLWHSEDSDQTARMRRLIWIFAGRTCSKLRFQTLRLVCVLESNNNHKTTTFKWKPTLTEETLCIDHTVCAIDVGTPKLSTGFVLKFEQVHFTMFVLNIGTPTSLKIWTSPYCYLLTHCILNRISHTIYWKSPISILGTSGYEI